MVFIIERNCGHCIVKTENFTAVQVNASLQRAKHHVTDKWSQGCMIL
jgi:hypothetical protein